MKRLLSIFLFAALLPATVALSQGANKQFTLGAISGSSYANSFFDMEIPIPNGWQVMGDAQQREMLETGIKNIGRDIDAETQRAVAEAMRTRTFVLLTLSNIRPQERQGMIFIAQAERIDAARTGPNAGSVRLRFLP